MTAGFSMADGILLGILLCGVAGVLAWKRKLRREGRSSSCGGSSCIGCSGCQKGLGTAQKGEKE